MMTLQHHPSHRTLSAYTDPATLENAPRRLRRHLANCAECRRIVNDAREIAVDAAAFAPSVGLRADALERVLRARSLGERRILPAEMPRSRTLRRSVVVTWAAAAALLVTVLLVVRAASVAHLTAAETSGSLSFSPERPTAGARVSIRYHPPLALAGARILHLRARFRTRWNAEYTRDTRQALVTVLQRTGGDEFRGTFELPSDVVYAAFAVEDSAGTIVDANDGKLWDILVYDGGRPSLAALQQQMNDEMDRSPDSALTLARHMTAVYPAEPTAWASRIGFESFMLGQLPDSVNAANVGRFFRFDSTLRGQHTVTPALMEGMLALSVQIAAPAGTAKRVADYWRERLAADAVGSPEAGMRAISGLNSRALRDSVFAAAAADSVERLWLNGDSSITREALYGFQIASRSGDSAAAFRWADRVAGRQPDGAEFLFVRLAQSSSWRPAALEHLRAIAHRYGAPDERRRPLELNKIQDARDRAEKARTVLASLGELLLAAGDTAAALDTLQRTLDGGWDLARFRRVADLYWRTRDTTAAARAYAFVVADLATPQSWRDSVGQVFSRLLQGTRWNDLIGSAREELRRRVLEGAVSQRLKRDVRLTGDDGRVVPLSSLTAGKVSVLAFWSQYCGPSRAQLPLYASLRSQFDSIGAAFIPVTVESPSRDLHDFLRAVDPAFLTWFDPHGDLRVATNNIGTPTYYVVDPSGRIRFVGHTPALALTQAAALVGK